MSYLSDLLGDNYKEGMTEDEISTLLEGIANNSANENTKLKNALSKANSEAADYKKQLRAKMSEEEAKEVARKEEIDKMLKENADLKRSISLSERRASLLGLGYEAKLAESTAIAMVDGDFDTVMKNQATFLADQEKKIRADQMRNTPRPQGGSDCSADMDYTAKIEEANARGDYSAVAYYTRLAAESSRTE